MVANHDEQHTAARTHTLSMSFRVSHQAKAQWGDGVFFIIRVSHPVRALILASCKKKFKNCVLLDKFASSVLNSRRERQSARWKNNFDRQQYGDWCRRLVSCKAVLGGTPLINWFTIPSRKPGLSLLLEHCCSWGTQHREFRKVPPRRAPKRSFVCADFVGKIKHWPGQRRWPGAVVPPSFDHSLVHVHYAMRSVVWRRRESNLDKAADESWSFAALRVGSPLLLEARLLGFMNVANDTYGERFSSSSWPSQFHISSSTYRVYFFGGLFFASPHCFSKKKIGRETKNTRHAPTCCKTNIKRRVWWQIITCFYTWSCIAKSVIKSMFHLRGGLQLPNFSENPNNVRKWVGGVNACSDWKCPTLDNFG